jgi:hypothetical protein
VPLRLLLGRAAQHGVTLPNPVLNHPYLSVSISGFNLFPFPVDLVSGLLQFPASLAESADTVTVSLQSSYTFA